MKDKYFLYGVIAGFIISITGVFFRLNHVEGDKLLLTAGLLVSFTLVVLALIKYRKSIFRGK